MEMAAFVTGGGGYVGSKLCRELLSNGYSVTAFDLVFPDQATPGIIAVRGDIRDGAALRDAVEKSRANVVFHLASYGMSGREQLDKKRIEEVNVNGTKNLLQGSSVHQHTKRGVWGTGDSEDEVPYFPLDKHVDHYSRTKAIAEHAVLAANGSLLAPRDGGERSGGEKKRQLKTCALRCAGIYGEGEQRHLPRIVDYMEKGLFQFTYGPKDSLVEFLHGENFVQAHIRAANAIQKQDSPVPGEAYFISDGKPVNNFEFFRPLCEGLGHSYPRIQLPLSLVFYAALLIEIVHRIVGRYIYNFQPLLTRAEVFKTGVTHYFCLDKARSHFGYSPQPRDMTHVVELYRERQRKQPHAHKLSRTWLCWFLPPLVGLIAIKLISLL